MLLRLVVILLLFIGFVMWAVGDGPELDRVALAERRVQEQRQSQLDVTRTDPQLPELQVETAKVESLGAPEPEQAASSGVAAQVDVIATTIPPEKLEQVQPSDGAATDAAVVLAVAEQSVESPQAEAVPEAVDQSIPLFVTGTRVNLRAGPSTNDSVIGSVRRGQQVYLLEYEDNGWARIRVDGIEQVAFMSADFLSDSR